MIEYQILNNSLPGFQTSPQDKSLVPRLHLVENSSQTVFHRTGKNWFGERMAYSIFIPCGYKNCDKKIVGM